MNWFATVIFAILEVALRSLRNAYTFVSNSRQIGSELAGLCEMAKPRARPCLAVALSIILVACLTSLVTTVQASPADPGHAASRISSGTFESGYFVFPNNLSVTQNFTVSTDTLYVDSLNGRVGIGTSTPTYRFEVASGVENAVNLSGILYINDTSDRVGIGTATPQQELDVVGDVNATGSVIFYDEIMPDGLTCSDGEILKRTSANDWDCALDENSGGNVTGNGGANIIPKWTGQFTLGNSSITDYGTFIDVNTSMNISGNITMPTFFFIGDSASATGSNSLAIGTNAQATNGTTVAIGNTANATGEYSITLGGYSDAPKEKGIAIGMNANAAGKFAVVLGADADATGVSAAALGYGAQATGSNAVALGYSANASGDYSTAVGLNSDATVDHATAIGELAQATGNSATSIGDYTRATATAATALGDSANATGQYATALGAEADAIHDNSVALGREAVTTAANQLMIGSPSYNLNTEVHGNINSTNYINATTDVCVQGGNCLSVVGGDITAVLEGWGINVTNSGGPQPRVNLSSFSAGDGLAFSQGVLSVNAGSGLQTSGDNVEVIAGSGLGINIDDVVVNTGNGIQISSDTVVLNQSCADGEVLKWNNTESAWICASDDDSGGTGDVTDVLQGWGITVTDPGGPQPRVNLSSGSAGTGISYTNGVLAINDGDGLGTSGDNVLVNVGNGIEISSDTVVLNQSCSNGEVLKWVSSGSYWNCSEDDGIGSESDTLDSVADRGATTDQNLTIDSDSDGVTNIADTLYVDGSSDQVGIGTQTPQQELDVVGNINATDNVTSMSDGMFSNQFRVRNKNTLNISTIETAWISVPKIQIPYYTNGDGPVYIIPDGSGNVSIGSTTTDGNRLYVSGNLEVNSGSIDVNASAPVINFVNETGNLALIRVQGGFMDIGDTTAAAPHLGLRLATSDLIRLTVLSSGEVGINAETPQNMLDVKGDINATGTINSSTDVCIQGGNCLSNVLGSESDTLQTVTTRGATTTDNVTIDSDSDGLTNISGTLYVDGSSDQVGIGTASPNRLLHVGNGTDAGQSYTTILATSTGDTGITVRDSTSDVEIEMTVFGGNGYVGAKTYDQLRFFTNDRWGDLVIDADGNIGINTTIPQTIFEIFTNHTSDGAFRLTRAATGRYGYLDVPHGAGSPFSIGASDGSSEVDAIQFATDTAGLGDIWVPNGKVGIGTTDPQQQLDVVGNINSTNYINATTDVCIQGGNCLSNVLGSESDTLQTVTTRGATTTDNVTIDSDSDGVTNIADTLYVDGSSDQVGIGTSNPNVDLEIADSSANAVLEVNRTDGVTAKISARVNEALFGTTTNHNLRLITNNAAKIYILNTGEVGIGDSTPDAILEVLDNSGSQLVLTHTDNVDYANFTVDSDGNLTISSSSGNVIIQLG
ncbi:MAG: hypothetical protein GTN76_07835 [Candidatus Aenigmarchaeota archaeon]|nr:hypothetical protein [Candidatus Aenigmarchaeota archaeon]